MSTLTAAVDVDVAVAVGVPVDVDDGVTLGVPVEVLGTVIVGVRRKGYACTWAGVAISQSISDANNSIAKQSTNAVPLETIFDRFSFVFIITFSNHRPPVRFPETWFKSTCSLS